MRTLRFDGETDDQFRQRAERAARYARILVDAALANHCIQDLIADPEHPGYTVERQQASPTVRIEFEEAYCISEIGEGIYATRSKHWGAGPYIHPLRPDDPVGGRRIIYVFKEESRYNRRFLQRQRLKELLGRRYRPLVERAKYHRHTQAIFLENLTTDEERALRRILKVSPKVFWRACRGKVFLDLPPRQVQLSLPFHDH